MHITFYNIHFLSTVALYSSFLCVVFVAISCKGAKYRKGREENAKNTEKNRET
jgi:hypothetical protein